MQQQQPGTVTHSRISSLLISRHLTRPRVVLRYLVWTSAILDTIVMCVMNVFTRPEVGVATQKFSGVLRAAVAEPPFLNF